MQQEEIWKDIPDYEGLYQVSNLGRVKRLKGIVLSGYGKTRTVSERICKPSLNTFGYEYVNLSKNGVHERFTIHRLVAGIFIPNPNNLPQVNHKDECKTNNAVSNLEWCTKHYNLTYGTRLQRMSSAIKCYSNDDVREFVGISEAVRLLGLPKSAIPNIIGCCKGKRKSAYGCRWEYLSE